MVSFCLIECKAPEVRRARRLSGKDSDLGGRCFGLIDLRVAESGATVPPLCGRRSEAERRKKPAAPVGMTAGECGWTFYPALACFVTSRIRPERPDLQLF